MHGIQPEYENGFYLPTQLSSSESEEEEETVNQPGILTQEAGENLMFLAHVDPSDRRNRLKKPPPPQTIATSNTSNLVTNPYTSNRKHPPPQTIATGNTSNRQVAHATRRNSNPEGFAYRHSFFGTPNITPPAPPRAAPPVTNPYTSNRRVTRATTTAASTATGIDLSLIHI